MAKRALSTLKSFFLTGLYPTQNQFHDTLDSFVHKDEGVGINQVTGLASALNDKYPQTSADVLVQQVSSNTNAIATMQEQIIALSTVRQRAYTLDFGTSSELVQDCNPIGAITINRIIARNVTALYVSYGDVVRQSVAINSTVLIAIPDGSILTWEIVRTTDDALACVGIKYELTTD